MLNRLYPLILWLALPFVWVRLQWRARRDPAYAGRQAERFGRVPENISPGPIWFHTVSAGESIAASGLIRQICEDYPGQSVLVTTMTPTGSEQVLTRLGDVVEHCYAPYDFDFAVAKFFRRVQPRMLVLMETELWPNLIRYAHKRNIPVVLVNARLSERSAKGYARISSITTPMLNRVRMIACQSEAHAQRFQSLGLRPDQVCVVGNVKYDLALPAEHNEAVARLQDVSGFKASGHEVEADSAPIWIAASTHPGEDEIVLAAHERVVAQKPDARLILVPRHPHRAEDLTTAVARYGWTYALQSQLSDASNPTTVTPSGDLQVLPQVLVGDVMGTLLTLYAMAQCAFVGGSLVPVGGHNPIEPALCEVPVITGPEQFNFADAYTQLLEAGGAVQIDDADSLAEAVLQLLDSSADGLARQQQQKAAASAVVASNTGATQRTLEVLETVIGELG